MENPYFFGETKEEEYLQTNISHSLLAGHTMFIDINKNIYIINKTISTNGEVVSKSGERGE